MIGSGQAVLQVVWEWSRDSPKCPGVIGCPPGCPGVVGSPTRMSGSGWEPFPDIWKWSGDPPEFPGVDGWPSRMSGSGQETLSKVREWLEALPDVRE